MSRWKDLPSTVIIPRRGRKLSLEVYLREKLFAVADAWFHANGLTLSRRKKLALWKKSQGGR